MVGLIKQSFKYGLILGFAALLLNSCKKKGVYYSTKSYVINKSNHQIQILPYFNGAVFQELARVIEPNTTKEVSIQNSYGLGYSTFGENLMGFDSVVVLFDGIKTSRHLTYYDSSTYHNSIKYSNNRSIINGGNWGRTTTYARNNRYEGFDNFYFFEQDFQNAK